MNTLKGFWVCGLPHILETKGSDGHASLSAAMINIGTELERQGFDRIVYYSTQWISVLGHSFQAGTNVQGTHTDENWYDLADLPFNFKIDKTLSKNMAAAAEKAGYQTRLIDYKGFPIDTGTIVADSLINKANLLTSMVSCCVYSDFADTTRLASVLKPTLEDGKKTAVVVVSTLSGRYFTDEIDLREDAIRDPADDKWNRRMLALLEAGDYETLEKTIPEYSRACKADMGMKGIAFLKGMGLLTQPAKVNAYGAVYGTGNAVVSFS